MSDGEQTQKRSPQYTQGYRAATKDAIDWLHRRAAEMNDPKARDVLNSAAFSYGQERASDKPTSG
jgi:NAD(P)H-dependent FMN reductase